MMLDTLGHPITYFSYLLYTLHGVKTYPVANLTIPLLITSLTAQIP